MDLPLHGNDRRRGRVKSALFYYPNPVYLNGKQNAYTFIEVTLPEKAKILLWLER